ncbi:MAG: PIG-L family deacetylase [Lachnospiraceae bacterium]|nr:PIG-L family deacetylase [Lachnospiraceae bacterium]
MSRVLLMVPHEDDESLVGGPMLVNLCRSGYEVFVYIATNGDYYPFESGARARESLEALKMMGVDRSKVIFGGYGDSWQGTGIYDSGYDEVKTSAAGFRATHGPARDIDEWHFVRTNEHVSYTKGAYREDIEELIDRLRPDVIITVGFDSHPDHRTLYLMTLEALALLFKKDPAYSPAFLEKFAYEGNAFGSKDFFRFPHLPSMPPLSEFGTAFNFWEDRICYRVPGDCNSVFMASNLLFKVLLCYRTQHIWHMADSVINSDTVYWQRNMANKILGAELTATSGEVCWLNDNKLFEPDNADEEYCDLTSLCFRPEPEDEEKTVKVRLKEPSDIKLILLYFNTPGGISTDVRLKLYPEDGREKVISKHYESKNDFSVFKIETEGGSCRGFSLRFENVRGSLGLGEIEALEKEPELPFAEFLAAPQDRGRSLFLTMALRLEWLLFNVMKLIDMVGILCDRKKARYDKKRFNVLPVGDCGSDPAVYEERNL